MTGPSAEQLERDLESALARGSSVIVTAHLLGQFQLEVVNDAVQFVRRAAGGDELRQLVLLPASCYRSRVNDEVTSVFKGETIDKRGFLITFSGTPEMSGVPVEMTVEERWQEAWED